MVVGDTAGAGGHFWTLEYWSSLSNIVGVFILAGAVPIITRILKRWEKMRQERKQAQNAHVMSLIKGVTDPIEQRIQKVEETNNSILQSVNNLTEGFDEFIKEQRDVNTKVNYIDKFFQNNTRLKHDDDDNNNRFKTRGNKNMDIGGVE